MTKTAILGTRLLDADEIEAQSGTGQTSAFWLVISGSGRRVSLPIKGEVILGRFDPSLSDPLDVDLTYEDQDALSVSRRHAKILVTDQGYVIEDLKSSNGLFVNGERVLPVELRELRAGDRILVGSVEIMYEEMPRDLLEVFFKQAQQLQHFFTITHTGRRIDVATTRSILIGRFDAENTDPVNINLVDEGDVSAMVSRRHAKIIWQNHQPTIEDIGSSFGTRLNGSALPPNRQAILRPGDHISLGGCVLAYDVEPDQDDDSSGSLGSTS